MTSTLQNRKFVLTYPNNYYLPPRSDGKIKTYDSCTDLRAWSLHEDERSDYLIDLMKSDTPDCRRLVPNHSLATMLSAIKQGLLKTVFKGLSLPYIQDEAAQVQGDHAEVNKTEVDEIYYPETLWSPRSERSSPFTTARSEDPHEQTDYSDKNTAEIPKIIKENDNEQIIASKDAAIAVLNKKIIEMQALFDAELKFLTGERRDSNEITKMSSDHGIERKHKPKSCRCNILYDNNRQQHGFLEERNINIDELKIEIMDLQAEKQILLEKNADMNREIEEFNAHLDSISELKNQLSYYLENVHHPTESHDENNIKLQDSFSKVLNIDAGRAKEITSDLYKQRVVFEDNIRIQLDEAVQMYQQAQDDLQEKNGDIERLVQELEAIKEQRDALILNSNKQSAEIESVKSELLQVNECLVGLQKSQAKKRESKSETAIAKMKTIERDFSRKENNDFVQYTEYYKDADTQTELAQAESTGLSVKNINNRGSSIFRELLNINMELQRSNIKFKSLSAGNVDKLIQSNIQSSHAEVKSDSAVVMEASSVSRERSDVQLSHFKTVGADIVKDSLTSKECAYIEQSASEVTRVMVDGPSNAMEPSNAMSKRFSADRSQVPDDISNIIKIQQSSADIKAMTSTIMNAVTNKTRTDKKQSNSLKQATSSVPQLRSSESIVLLSTPESKTSVNSGFEFDSIVLDHFKEFYKLYKKTVKSHNCISNVCSKEPFEVPSRKGSRGRYKSLQLPELQGEIVASGNNFIHLHEQYLKNYSISKRKSSHQSLNSSSSHSNQSYRRMIGKQIKRSINMKKVLQMLQKMRYMKEKRLSESNRRPNVTVIKGHIPYKKPSHYPETRAHPANGLHQISSNSHIIVDQANIEVKFLNYSMNIKVNNNAEE